MPGPGSHATERSFVSPDQNEFDAKRCVEVGRVFARQRREGQKRNNRAWAGE